MPGMRHSASIVSRRWKSPIELTRRPSQRWHDLRQSENGPLLNAPGKTEMPLACQRLHQVIGVLGGGRDRILESRGGASPSTPPPSSPASFWGRPRHSTHSGGRAARGGGKGQGIGWDGKCWARFGPSVLKGQNLGPAGKFQRTLHRPHWFEGHWPDFSTRVAAGRHS